MSLVTRLTVLALVFGGMLLSLPFPWVFWSLTAILTAPAAVLTWRRTRLWMRSTAMAILALFSGVKVLCIAAGTDQPQLLGALSAMLITLLLVFIEWRLYPQECRRWRKHVESCTVLDFLTLRTIPDWRRDAVKSQAPQ